MNSFPPLHLGGAGTATLEHATLRDWFAQLGEAAAQRYSSGPSTRFEHGDEPGADCPHPERCRFTGCKRSCNHPLPAA